MEVVFMDYNKQQYTVSQNVDLARHVSIVYAWMFFGLLVTAISSIITVGVPAITSFVFSSNVTFYGLIILEIAFVIFISARITKMNYGTAAFLFTVYSALNGLTLSSIFFIYAINSIYLAFFVAAGFFATMAVYGLVTRKDLTSIGRLLSVGVIILIIVMIINIFIRSSTMMMIYSFFGVVIFLGLTAYDNQKIKKMYYQLQGSDKLNNIAIYGALMLYLDFINLFLFILRILGRRR
jgi:hypothetical protein